MQNQGLEQRFLCLKNAFLPKNLACIRHGTTITNIFVRKNVWDEDRDRRGREGLLHFARPTTFGTTYTATTTLHQLSLT
jgi:hypothetical protein